MKQFLKIAGYVVLGFVVCLYLAFLFVLPRVVDLNKYKPEIQKLVMDNTKLSLDFEDFKLITTPVLEAGIFAKNISVKLPDSSSVFESESAKVKVSLPALLFMTVRVSCVDVESPKLNIEILNGEKFKIGKLYEDIVNEQRRQRLQNQNSNIKLPENEAPFDLSKIKIVIPSFKLNNYQVVIDDTKNNHNLTLKGDKLKLGYFNGKVAKLKTTAHFYSDKEENVTANLDINTFLPEFKPQNEEIDDEAVFALPFVNPVSVYRDYNLKSNINAKLKIRHNKRLNRLWAKGFLNIDDTTLTLSGMPLPKSHFDLKAKGFKTFVDSNIYVTNNEFINILGNINTGAKPSLDLNIKSTPVYFNNILKITKAYLDTIHIKNDLANISVNGYLFSDFRLKTNFKKIKSDGKFIIRDGNINHKDIGLVFDDINANVLFDNNRLLVDKTYLLVNGKAINIKGKIEENSNANFDISADRIPLKGLYLAFAPREIKNAYNLKSGDLTLKTRVHGQLKDTAAFFKVKLEDFMMSDYAGTFNLSNKVLKFGLVNIQGETRARFRNEDFNLNLPPINSTIADKLITAHIDDNDVIINDSDILFNKNSVITFNGKVSDYVNKPNTLILASGAFDERDLKTLIGEAAAPYLDALGSMPLKAKFESKGDKAEAIVQVKADSAAYITPVTIDKLTGKQAILQLFVKKNGNELKLKKSGLYLRKANAKFKDNLRLNILNAEEIMSIRAIISNLNTAPFINLLKIRIPKDLDGSICALKGSRFRLGGGLFAFGKVSSPSIRGNFYVRNLLMPELLTNVRDIEMNLGSRELRMDIRDVNANGSDFNINLNSSWQNLAQSKISNVRVLSRNINVDKLMKVSEALTAALPAQNSSVVASQNADIPVEILDGSINLNTIKTGDIIVKDTTSKISLLKNILYLNNLKTRPMGGIVDGKASMNLLTYELKAQVQGKNFDMEKVLLDTMQMKDMLSGDMRFIADISLKGLDMEEQMKSLKGYVDFDIRDGQLGPFGKFENFLMAENLRENPFFASTIGSVIKNIVTIDTSHFNTLFGHLTFNDGFANIEPIKTQGNVMSMYIAGKVGLIDNSADMKVRGKLASMFSDSLGPLANINPVNLIKNTPGLNIVAAKTFMIFCEQVSQEEMDALPELGGNKTDDYATKFQIGLRGDTRKPLKMIKSFKWLALNSDIESAQNFVDTIPMPEPGEENLSVEELIQLRAQQAAGQAVTVAPVKKEKPKKSILGKLKNKIKK